MDVAILISCYIDEKNKISSFRPPLSLFFEKLFETLHTTQSYRIILSDDGSVESTKKVIRDLAKQYPIEIYFRDHAGEGANLKYMSTLLKNESHVLYTTNDNFIRNLDKVDWLKLEMEILSKFACCSASIAAGFKPPELGCRTVPPETCLQAGVDKQINNYKYFRFLSAQHFMMKREQFDKIDWNAILTEIGENYHFWEASFNKWLKKSGDYIACSSNRLGMWSIMKQYSLEKVNRILYTTEDFPYNV